MTDGFELKTSFAGEYGDREYEVLVAKECEVLRVMLQGESGGPEHGPDMTIYRHDGAWFVVLETQGHKVTISAPDAPEGAPPWVVTSP